MTTKKQVRQLFLPILKRNRDVVQLDRITIWLTPIRHLACRMTVDRCLHPDVPVPSWHITDLIEPHHALPDFGRVKERLYRRQVGKGWCWSDIDMEETLRAMIELEVLPFFRKVATLENYVALQRRHHMWGPNHTPINDLILDIAVGNLSEATRQFNVVWGQCQNYLNYIYRERKAAIRGFNKELSMLALLRDDLLSENRTGLAKTLFAWESENITRLGIEQIWEPTPFPLERGGEAMSPVSEDMVARLESMIRITPRKIWADEA